ncbi:hypothetical protein PPACK8108_LOCUS4309 [Phakopsora pachyrhizi]|uniref:Uncharacterized protein n=1 Tax=Phakopsora pachyrhizi TaxID=170000 RepID=A0AAV0AN38_PHAPC|nr:hypothetical protein PPACK8108_LOCUS4309 [Phakopsora pachyrhizi]
MLRGRRWKEKYGRFICNVNTGVSSAKPLMRRAESDTLINSAKPQSSSSSSPTLAALKASKSFAEGPNDSSNTQPNRLSGRLKLEGSSLHIEGTAPLKTKTEPFLFSVFTRNP